METGNREILRGQIYYADFGNNIGSEQNGYRPAVIIQNNVGNKYSPTLIVAAVTSVDEKRNLPTHVEIDANFNNGLKKYSIILLEQIKTIDKTLLGDKLGELSSFEIKELNRALAISVGLNNKKIKKPSKK